MIGSANAEKRQFTRFPIDLLVRVKTSESCKHYFSKDANIGGLFILADELLADELLEETKVDLELFLPKTNSPVKAKGEVVWKQRIEPPGFAIKFVEISELAKSMIRNLTYSTV